ncbi:MAG: hypothetical protein KF855_15145 [Acidobacteria bacterium]|nr:hypothetical protein [Acidobacteriota bacterium]
MLKLKVFVLSLVFLATIGVIATNAQIDSIAKSHIEANVPDAQHFDEYLKSALEEYFKGRTGKDVSVEYELLRLGPTQSGIAYPKFYAWIKVVEKEKIIDQGAVRLAAIDKKRFEITHYLKCSEVIENPESAAEVFPSEVVEKIKQKIDDDKCRGKI